MKGIELLNKIYNKEIKSGTKIHDRYNEYEYKKGNNGYGIFGEDQCSPYRIDIVSIKMLDKEFWLNKKDVTPMEVTMEDIEKQFGCKVKIKEWK